MEIMDIIAYIIILFFVLAIFYISNKEIKTALGRAQKAQQNLEKEKEGLMKQIELQTGELKKSENARLNELAKVVEFGRLSQGLFHDLMTPLSSIILHTEKLKNASKNDIEATQKALEKAVSASERMGGYIQNIRTTLHNEHIEKDCNLQAELSGITELLAYKARQANVLLRTKSEHECVIFTDPIKVRQVFSNLISNAIDSFDDIKDDRTKTADIFLSKENGVIIFKVHDNGSGIPPQNLARIFDPFFTTKPTDKGTGIGLSIVKGIVENDLKGSVSVESRQKEGSTFSITIPFAIP